jgi:hypothetical protein
MVGHLSVTYPSKCPLDLAPQSEWAIMRHMDPQSGVSRVQGHRSGSWSQ